VMCCGRRPLAAERGGQISLKPRTLSSRGTHTHTKHTCVFCCSLSLTRLCRLDRLDCARNDHRARTHGPGPCASPRTGAAGALSMSLERHYASIKRLRRLDPREGHESWITNRWGSRYCCPPQKNRALDAARAKTTGGE
jgi:hypothetical protein